MMPLASRTALGVAAIMALTLLPSCSDGDSAPTDAERAAALPPENLLGGRPRTPDDAGVATEIGETSITLDDSATYPLSPAAVSFSVFTREPEDVGARVGQYVQVGLSGGIVIWIAGFGGVLEGAGERLVGFTGTVESVAGSTVTFEGGTVLTLAPEAQPPEPGAVVDADIDVSTDTVIAIRDQDQVSRP